MWLAARLVLAVMMIGLSIGLSYSRDPIFAVVMVPVALIIAVGALIIHRSEARISDAHPAEAEDVDVRKATGLESRSMSEIPDDEGDRWGEALATRLSVGAIIEYRDGMGDETEREITINAVYGERARDGAVNLSVVRAYCHLRRDNRTFYVARILSIADVKTGELGDDPAAWICQRARIEAKRIRVTAR